MIGLEALLTFIPSHLYYWTATINNTYGIIFITIDINSNNIKLHNIILTIKFVALLFIFSYK